jgi:hypothetical protein
MATYVFVLAMMRKDKEALQQGMWPHPEADVLLGGDNPPPEASQRFQAEFNPAVQPNKYKRSKVGESFTLPGGHTLTVSANDINENRVLISLGGGPPFAVERRNGVWKVDATALIEARKAAAKVRGNARQNGN